MLSNLMSHQVSSTLASAHPAKTERILMTWMTMANMIPWNYLFTLLLRTNKISRIFYIIKLCYVRYYTCDAIFYCTHVRRTPV